MKIPNWVRITLWLVLIAFFTWLLSQRYNAIINGTSNVTDIMLILIWIALIAAFVFQEVDFFGVKIRREIENLKTEFRAQLLDIRTDIQTRINMRTEINPQINLLTPPSNSEMRDLEERVKPILEKTLREKGIGIKRKPELEVSDDTKFLFEVRHTIEKELRRIWKQYQEMINATMWRPKLIPTESERPQSVFQLARSLDELRVLAPEISAAIREVYRACSPAIHGEEVSQTTVGFVRDVAPALITSLKAIEVTYVPKGGTKE